MSEHEHIQLSSAYNQHHCDVHDSVTLRCVTRCVTSRAGAGGGCVVAAFTRRRGSGMDPRVDFSSMQAHFSSAF